MKSIKSFLKKRKDTIAGMLVLYNIAFVIYGVYYVLVSNNIMEVKGLFGLFALKISVLTLLSYVLYIKNSIITDVIEELVKLSKKN